MNENSNSSRHDTADDTDETPKQLADTSTEDTANTDSDDTPLLTEHTVTEEKPGPPPDLSSWQDSSQSEPSPQSPSQPQPSQLSPQPVVPSKNNAVEIVWQWVSYGLWEWALISLSVLLSATFAYYLSQAGDETAVTYSLATMICLLPLAYLADWLYRKKEPAQKHGFAGVILVLNAVIVFLAAIGALISGVVSGLISLTSDTSSSNTTVFMLSSFVIAILAGLLFIRILHPQKLKNFSRLFPIVVLVVAGIATGLAVAGPFRSQILSKQDRLIESNLPSLSDEIRTYVVDHKKLPESLQTLQSQGSDQIDSQALQTIITRRLVGYQIIQNGTTTGVTGGVTIQTYPPQTKPGVAPTTSFEYRLCTTYRNAKGSGTSSTSTDTYIDTSQHPAGPVCYNQTAE